MKKEEYIHSFEKTLSTGLNNYENGVNAKYLKALMHALKESLADDNATKENIKAIEKKYFLKLDKLVENQHKKTSNNKIPYIKGMAAKLAKEVFHEIAKKIEKEISNETIKKDENIITNKKSNYLQENDIKFFKSNDYDYNKNQQEFSKQEFSDLQYAENCCAYPKLAVYLKYNVKVSDDMSKITSIINEYCSKNGINGTDINTSETVDYFQKNIKSSKLKF